MDSQIMDTSSPRESVEISYEGADRGSTLVINLAEDQDAGQYMCVMGNKEKTSIKHTVIVRGEIYDPFEMERFQLVGNRITLESK